MTDAEKMRVWMKLSENQNKDEMWEYMRISPKYTGLPYDIFIDDNEAYKHNSHELWLYVSYNGIKIPVTISSEPIVKALKPNGMPDLYPVICFIKKNKEILTLFADGNVEADMFVKFIEHEQVLTGKFVNGFALYKVGEKYNFMREDGSFLFNEPIFDAATNFMNIDGKYILAYVQVDGESYYINNKGERIDL